MPAKLDQNAWKKRLIDDAETKILALTNSEKFKAYLQVLSKFHQYSQRNVELIFSQNPQATQLAGFKKWATDFDRHVKKGSKAIRVCAPMVKKLTPAEKERLKTEEDRIVTGYRFIPVFDISQTTGKAVLSARDFVQDKLTEHENVTALYEALTDNLNKKTSLKITERPLVKGEMKGYFNPQTNEIVINQIEEDSAFKLKTLYHEYAHSQLHGLNAEFQHRTREYQETQAEAVAYVAMQNIGIDTGNYSLGYVATWAQSKKMIHEALSEIHQVSRKIIELTDKITQQLQGQAEQNKKIEQLKQAHFKFKERPAEITGIIQETQIGLTELEYYSADLLKKFSVGRLTKQELVVMTFNLLGQVLITWNELASMKNDDPDFKYWQTDFEHEQDSYQTLAVYLEKCGVLIPPSLNHLEDEMAIKKVQHMLQQSF